MNNLQRYLFWWICGALLVVELCLMIFWTPDAKGDDPETVKNKLDAKVKELNRVFERTKTPPGLFNPEDPVDIQHLTNDYLITPKWEGVLKPAVDKYQQQLEGISADLADRSKLLRDPLVDTTNLVAWQDRYLDESEQLLRRLDEAGQLVMPEKGASRGHDAAAVDDASRFRDDERVRKVAGLETPQAQGGRTFKLEDHPKLTARLRIVEQVVDALTKISADVVPNPAVNAKAKEVAAAKPRLAGLDWTERTEPFKGATAAHISDSQLATIRLQGPESALVAAIAALEQLDKPVVVVTSASLERLDTPPGKRLGSADLELPCQAKIELLVLDMTPPAQPAAGGKP